MEFKIIFFNISYYILGLGIGEPECVRGLDINEPVSGIQNNVF